MKTKNFLSQSGGKPDVTRRQNRNRLGSVISRLSLGSIVSRFSLVSLICVLMLTLGVVNALGETVTINSTNIGTFGWNTTQGSQTGSTGGITITSDNGARNSTTQMRFYSGGTHTFTSSVGNITKVEFTCTASGTSNYGPGKMSLASGSAGSYSYSGTVGTWTGNAASFTLSGGQSRCTSIVITYTAAGATITTDASSMTTLTYSNGSPVAQSFSIGGSGLTSTVTVTAPANYEVCKTSGGTYTSSITFTHTEVNAADKTVYIRLQSGLSAGNIASSNVTVASSGASTQNVAVTGSVPYTITWMANGSTHATTYVAVGSTLALPATDPVPNSCGCTGKYFYGWYGDASSYESASVAPTIAAAGNAVNADKTYYAVFADRSGSGAVTWDKVTSAPSDWSGDYVIVASDNANAMISDFRSGTSGEFNSASVTINAAGTQITSTPTDKMIWTFAKNGNNAQYSLKNKSTSTYAQITGTNSTNAALNASAQWFTIESTATSGVWDVASVANSARCFAWFATNSSFRTYAKSTYNTGRLFKKSGDGYTWSNYVTTCCTLLGSINGSIKSISGTSATLKWDNLSGVDGTTPYTVTVSPSAGTSVGAISIVDSYKNCTVSGLTAGTAYTFTINAFGDASHCDASQEVAATTPKITVTPVTITGLNYAEGNGPSTAQTFTVSAVGLTGNLSIEAPANFEVCLTNSATPGDWKTNGTPISITPSSGSVSSTTVYVRLKSGLSQATYGASNVTVGGGSATTVNVSVTGVVSSACEKATINTHPASATYNLNASPAPLTVSATKNGSGPALTYQWYSNTTATNSGGTPISGATSATYALPAPTTATTGNKYFYCVVSSGACEQETNVATITVNTPSITVSTTSIAFGDRAKDGSFTETFTVSGSNLASGQGLTIGVTSGSSYFTVSPTSKSQTSSGTVSSTTITVTYAPTAIGDHSATITVSSTGATSKTVTLTGSSKYKITWVDNAANPATSTDTYVASGKPTFPSDPTGGCDTYTYFYGWAEGTFTTPVTAPTSSSTIKVYKSASEMPNVSGNVTYYAVWADSPGGWSKASSIAAGDVVVFVNESASQELTSVTSSTTDYGHVSDYSSTPNGTYPLTVEAGNGGSGFSFKNGLNYICYDSDLTSGSNYLWTITSKTNYSSWTVSISNGDATITNVANTTRKLQFNGSSNPKRFSCYTSAQSAVQIYKQSAAGNCVTSCCTEVAARSGSVTMGSTSATVSWSVTGTAASKISSWDVSCNVTGGASAGTKGSITGTTTKSIEFTGLQPNTGYTFHILGTSNDDAYCAVDDELTGTTECQTPSSLSIASTGNKWDFCAGETMTLTLSGSNISGSATYQWKKWNGSSWDNIAGANSTSYSTTMAAAKAGQYCCTVTNPGSGSCSATSGGVWVRVWQLHLGDDDIDFTNTGSGTGSNTAVYLNSDTHYEFKLKDNNGGWFGLNDKTITGTIAAFALNGTGANVNLNSGLEGNYTFAINYSDKNYPTIAVTYPTGNQTANYDIWFDKSVVDGWNVAQTSDLFLRIGNTSTNKNNVTESVSWSLVPGTDRFYTIKTLAATGFEAWQIANNTSWSGSNSIYLVNGSGYAITKGTTFQKYVVDASGVTLVPVLPSSGTSDGCAYYEVTKTIGMLSHTATITTPSNGTIHLAYTDVSGTAQDKTSTTAGLAHRTMIKATASPAAGYELSTFTVTPDGESAINLVPTLTTPPTPQTVNHILAKDATFAATFSAKVITITWNANGGNTVVPGTSSYTYNSATVSLPTPTHATKIFAGWWTDPSAGTQITEIGTTNKPSEDVTYYAHWSDGNTVYFHPGVGSVTPTSATQATIGGPVSIPTPTIDCDGWSFAGWNVGSALAETTTNPEASLVAGGSSYVPASAAVHMYAVWKKNFGGGTGTVTNTYTWETTNSAWLTSSISGVTTYSTIAHTGTYAGEMSATSAYVQFLTKLSSPLSFKIYYTQTSNNDNSANKWNVQISDNGSSWTTVTSSEGANKSYKNTWRELDVDLSSYSNKYVRVAWGSANSGSFVLDDVSVSYTGTIPDAWKWTSSADDYGCTPANQVKTPVISPDTEDQTGDVSVTITCATDGATIRYTTDGTNPSSSVGTVYSGAFTVSCSATVKAIAYKATMDDSEIASQAYTVTVPTPTFSLAEGTYYDANQSVTLSLPTAHTGTVIKYTTNGDDPTSSSATYSSAITVTEGTTTIKAIGYNSTCSTSSSIASATYIVRFGTDYTLVTDANDLMAGDQVVIISADAGTSSKYAISTTISSNKRTSTSDYNINAGLTTAKIYPAVGAAATVQVFTLGGEPGAWTFHETTNNGYLNCPSAGKLTNTVSVSNSNKWTIAIASNIATIHNNDVDATIKSNTSSGHVFAAYAPATENVQLVKLYSIPNPEPVIKIDADLSAFSACRGIASEAQSIYVSGKNLDGNIVLSNVLSLSGYEFSTDGSSYSATLNLVPVSKTVAKTRVYVRLAATATAGTKNGNLNAAVSANSLSTNIAVTGSVSTADTYTDQIHNQVVANQCGEYYAPTCSDTGTPADESCIETHFKFMGWITETDRNSSAVKNDAWYLEHLITAGSEMTANGTNYYAVWAKEEE